jgi:hypothetical protein
MLSAINLEHHEKCSRSALHALCNNFDHWGIKKYQNATVCGMQSNEINGVYDCMEQQSALECEQLLQFL